MFDEFGQEDDNWRPAKSKFRVIGFKVFRISFTVMVFGLIGLIVFRSVVSKLPEEMKEYVWTENSVSAFQSDEDFNIYHYITTNSFTKDRMFAISNIYHTPASSQIQVSVRYNNRSLNYLKEDYPNKALPEGEIYVFVLRDNFGKTYSDYSYTKFDKSSYTYRKLIFDSVDMEDVSALYLDIYYIGDVRSDSERGTLNVYSYDYAKLDYDFLPPQSEKVKKPQIFASPEY